MTPKFSCLSMVHCAILCGIIITLMFGETSENNNYSRGMGDFISITDEHDMVSILKYPNNIIFTLDL